MIENTDKKKIGRLLDSITFNYKNVINFVNESLLKKRNKETG